jgi:hypothetical protein
MAMEKVKEYEIILRHKEMSQATISLETQVQVVDQEEIGSIITAIASGLCDNVNWHLCPVCTMWFQQRHLPVWASGRWCLDCIRRETTKEIM